MEFSPSGLSQGLLHAARGWMARWRKFIAQPRPRLPCVGLFLAAAVGVVGGHYTAGHPAVPVAWALSAAVLLLAVFFLRGAVVFWLGVMSFFSALQSGHVVWSAGRLLLESSAAHQARAEHDGPALLFSATVRVLEPPKPQGAGWTFRAMVEKASFGDTPAPSWPVPVLVHWPGAAPAYGDVLVAVGSLAPIAGPRNPGEFNEAAWLHREGVWAEWRVPKEADATVLTTGGGNPLLRLALAARAQAQRLLAVGIEDFPSIQALLQAMTIGDAAQLTPEQLEAFRETGTLHLFSVSGLHVGMMAVIFWFALKILRLPFPVQVVSVMALLFFYAAVTGLRPASVRAAFMASVVLAGWLLARPSSALNSLAAAGFVLLLSDTPLLLHPGFQLSFLVVFFILVLGAPLARWLKKQAGPDPWLPPVLYGWRERAHAWIVGQGATLAAVSWSAWLGSLPLLVAHYHLVSFSALLANLWAVPLAFVVLALAMLALVSGVFSLWLAAIFNHANILCAGLLLQSILLAAEVPGGSWRVTFFPPPPLVVTILDLGAGGAQVLHYGGQTLLIDTGSMWAWERSVRPYLQSIGTNRLQGLVLSHGDAKHVGAARLAVEEFRPAWVAVGALPERSRTFRDFVAWMEVREGHGPEKVRAGQVWSLGEEARLEVLAPPAEWAVGRADERALVLRWVAPELRVLFLGDAGLALQDWLLQQAPVGLTADVVVLGRPESGEIPRQELWRRIGAKVIVVTAADFPSAQRFSPLWEAALAQSGARVFRQDVTGAVRIEAQDQRMHVRGFLVPQAEYSWPIPRR